MATMGIRIAPSGKYRDLIRKMSKASMAKTLNKKTEEAQKALAEHAKDMLSAGIVSQRAEWKELHPLTKEIKGQQFKLMETGDFLRSITTWRQGRGKGRAWWFAGIKPGSKNRHGSDLTMIGIVHEDGAVVPVSDSIKRFFAAKGFPLKETTKFVRIPARPWFAPAVEEVDRDADTILEPMIESVLREFR